LGFRTGTDSTATGVVNLIGNSVSFGIGLDYNQTFGSILAANMGRKLNNVSYGCYLHENHDHLNNIKILTETGNDTDIYIVQINNLDRRRVDQHTVLVDNDHLFCKTKFLDYFDQINELLRYKHRLFLYWDNKSYDLPRSITDQFTIFNKFCLDTSLPLHPDTFGHKSHLAIAKILTIKAGLIPPK
jgi:hypothetical protein